MHIRVNFRFFQNHEDISVIFCIVRRLRKIYRTYRCKKKHISFTNSNAGNADIINEYWMLVRILEVKNVKFIQLVVT